MKNAKLYQKKIKKLLRGSAAATPAEIPAGPPRVWFLIETVLGADATRRQAASAIEALQEEYVDLNELRVSPLMDITDCVGRDMTASRQKAEMIVGVLNNVFLRVNDNSLDWLAEIPRRELRRTLTELGLGPYPAAAVAMRLFDLHAVPVDITLLECLKADGAVHPSSNQADVQAFLEKLISPKALAAAHEALRAYAEKRVRTLPKKPVIVPPPPVVEAEEKEVEEIAPGEETGAKPAAAGAPKPAQPPAVVAPPAHAKPAAAKAAPKEKKAAKAAPKAKKPATARPSSPKSRRPVRTKRTAKKTARKR
jgi:endonuclease III